MSDTVILATKIQPSIKGWVEEHALAQRTSMSDIVRRAIIDYLTNHATTEEEREVGRTVKRRRIENMKLEIPKDEFNTLLFPNRIKTYVDKIKYSWQSGGFLNHARYDNLVDFVEKQKKVVEGNPNEGLVVEMIDQIIAGLRSDQAAVK